MSRELLLLRHGKSDWDNDLEDFYRPIKDRGKRAAQRMGVWLAQNGHVPAYILSSPAVRALETARKCVKAMGGVASAIEQDPRIYEASPEQLLKVLAGCPTQAQSLLLVGHNPGFEQLLAWLLGDDLHLPPDGKLMPTACLARLQLPDDWTQLERGCARLLDHIRPQMLPKKFPFTSASGTEYRDRPAYYYQQSAVIPYRKGEDGMEVLLVSASSGRHWVVPKGIQEPGLSPQASATKEAEEEAGILRGRVEPQALGQYSYNKWGSRCQVSVYAMQVEELSPEADWNQGQRQRKWVPSARVAGYLKQPELADLVLELAQRHRP
jgi:phosphohistidine phosphatase